MPLYIIGTGLRSFDSITLSAHKKLLKCKSIYFECYTSIYPNTDNEELKSLYPCAKVVFCDREFVESKCDIIINDALTNEVAFLVVGDCFAATTHTDLYLRAYNAKVPISIEHNASIMNAISSCGLQLYRFGATVSVPYWTDTWKPISFVDKILTNYKNDLHTLVLLDIKVKEQTTEDIIKGNMVYQKPKFMSIKEALEQLSQTHLFETIPQDELFVGAARVGCDDAVIRIGTKDQLMQYDFGGPLHSIVIPAPNLDSIEFEFTQTIRIDDE